MSSSLRSVLAPLAVFSLFAAAIPACGGGGDGSVTQTPGGTGGTGAAGAAGKGGTAGSGGGVATACKDSSTCTGGKQCCSGVCVDEMTDVQHCGACTPCPGAMTGDVQCVAGACKAQCLPGKADCNGKPDDGCETFTGTDANNCGKCGSVCNIPNGIAVCSNGMCSLGSCSQGHGDCDKNGANGCEADFDHDPKNCGSCGNACPSPANTVPTCQLGKCSTVLQCKTGFADCNGKADDGCEVDTTKDPAHCGTCGTTCGAVPHGKAGCINSACGIASCDTNFADCNKSIFDGCEAPTDTDASNCGACGQKCTAPAGGTASCMASKCALGGCMPGFADCDMNATNGCETNLATDPKHCGSCTIACPAPANGTASCNNFACGIASCAMGFDHCVGPVSNGCETPLNTTDHCGSCTNSCSALPHATAGCMNAGCVISTCDAGYKDCNAKPADGCEISVDADPKNCGKCGVVCPALPNALPGCTATVCGIGSCVAGFHDCDGMDSNGCERATSTDSKNCGGCGIVCGSGSCVNSACVCSPTVLLLKDDSDATGLQAVVSALSAAGLTVTVSSKPISQYDGASPAPTGFGSVVVLSSGPQNSASQSADMPAAGQQALVDFVAASNGIVFTEWAAFHVLNGQWKTLAPLVLLQRAMSANGIIEYDVDPAFTGHPLWAGLPATFKLSGASNVGLAINVSGVAVVAHSPQANDAVAIREIAGSGRVVHVAHTGNYNTSSGWSGVNNAPAGTLLGNAASWAARCK
jgi:hypothetical protein